MSARSRKEDCLQSGMSPGWRRWIWLVAGASGALAAQAASADPQVVLPNGLPVQVKPTYSEPGLPAFSFPIGGGSLLGGSTGKSPSIFVCARQLCRSTDLPTIMLCPSSSHQSPFEKSVGGAIWKRFTSIRRFTPPLTRWGRYT
jgi:hypothetical protein